ncbi:MAG: phenylalanine--tRNA ligase subunit beta [Nitrospinae bacterium]|nr:phenylalanine--tRNA ligase subunit beta [Nitrospinota bacterium]
MKITYNWLKKFVEFDLSPVELSKKLTMAGLETTPLLSTGELGGADDDPVIEVDLTPNRSDCHSVIGIARETAALTCGKFISPDTSVKEQDGDINNLISVSIENPDLCYRYTARIIKGVKIEASPLWLEKRLKAVGIRPINNVVDATNYILWETGQPLHAFDYNCIKDNKIIVRKASKNELFITLDGKEHKLTEDSLVIADSERAVALAGIMGGENSGVTSSTKDVLLESAYFNPISIRRTSRRHGIFTDSSYRFERGVDHEAVITALDIAARLISKLSGGKVIKGRLDCNPPFPPLTKGGVGGFSSPQIELRISRTNKILGTSLNRDYISNLLQRLMCRAEVIDNDKLKISVPSFRRDIEREVDLIEEVARLNGYENISKTIPSSMISTASLTKGQGFERNIRNILTSTGLTEVINYSFIDDKYFDAINIPQNDPLRKTIKLRNPLSQNWSVMRTTLLPGIIQTVVFNINRGVNDVGIFEIGKVFIPHEDFTAEGAKNAENYKKKPNAFSATSAFSAVKRGVLPVEKMIVGGAVTEKREKKIWSKGERDFYYLKGIVESLLDRLNISDREFCPPCLSYIHPQRGAGVKIKGEEIGFIGELHSASSEGFDLKDKVYVFELNIEKIISKTSAEKKYMPLPKYPSIHRDIAIVLDSNIRSEDVYRLIRETDHSILKDIILFDYYEGKQIPAGKKSLAYSLVYRSDDRTLTDEDVNPLHEKIIANLKDKLEAVLR